ncbi:MAG: protein-glutamate methylesterase CheB3 [Pseudomonadota bacterium]|jgi:two-component system chemotaxis response regulator CheB
MHDNTRVLIVDDSPLFTDALMDLLGSHPRITVVGIARNGVEALQLVKRLEPDLITMDIHMPMMDGLEAVARIMAERPTPIMVLTADEKSRDQSWCFEALRRGALELMAKPDIDALYEAAGAEFCERVRLLACIPVVHHARVRRIVPSMEPPMPGRPDHIPAVVGIVASTGGPSAIAEVLAELPPTFPLPIVIVQHLAAGFAPHLASWLRELCALEVKIAERGMPLESGVILIAPEGHHLVVNPGAKVGFVPGEGDTHCPSGDRLLASIAGTFRDRGIGIVLTGMGRDGARGLLKMKQAGAVTIAQSGETSVVDGMPRAARENGAAAEVSKLSEIAGSLLRRARTFTLMGRS